MVFEISTYEYTIYDPPCLKLIQVLPRSYKVIKYIKTSDDLEWSFFLLRSIHLIFLGVLTYFGCDLPVAVDL